MRIYFGKYSGKDITELETSYLVWLVESCDTIDSKIRDAAVVEIAHRLRVSIEIQTPEILLNRIDNLQNRIQSLLNQIKHLNNIIRIASICHDYVTDNAYNDPQYAEDLINIFENHKQTL